MDIKSENITTGPLSSSYSAYYKEFQVRNWTPIDLVVTESNGTQHLVPASTGMRETGACAEIEFRTADGMRSKLTDFGTEDLQINGTRTLIPLDLYRNGPFRVSEHNIIISTVDHAFVAKEMLTETSTTPLLYETRTDDEICDPRFVFQVIDPGNRWDALFVNVFGQTIILRAGHWAHALPPLDDGSGPNPQLQGRLICYLRYPSEYYTGARPVTTVFDVALDNLEDETPIMIPGGDVVCVATSIESLQRVLAKKAAGNRGIIPANMVNTKMVPKDMYDTAQSTHEAELERVKQECKTKIETLNTNHASEVSGLKFEIQSLKQEKIALEAQVKRWTALSESEQKIREHNADLEELKAKARKEVYDAERKDIENMWTILKFVGMAAAGVISFAITMVAKSKK